MGLKNCLQYGVFGKSHYDLIKNAFTFLIIVILGVNSVWLITQTQTAAKQHTTMCTVVSSGCAHAVNHTYDLPDNMTLPDNVLEGNLTGVVINNASSITVYFCAVSEVNISRSSTIMTANGSITTATSYNTLYSKNPACGFGNIINPAFITACNGTMYQTGSGVPCQYSSDNGGQNTTLTKAGMSVLSDPSQSMLLKMAIAFGVMAGLCLLKIVYTLGVCCFGR